MPDSPRSLLATADLHFGLHPEGDAAVLRLARHVSHSDADVLVVAGDVADVGKQNLETCLGLFDQFKGLKLLVPGNHDLWTTSGDSMEQYREVLPRLAGQRGFRMLDTEAVCAGQTGFIGNIGWYDYSLRNPDLGLSEKTYRSKALPGICSWSDRVYVKWHVDDEQFTEMCLRKLRRHYSTVAPRVERVVAVLHHLPFAEMIQKSGSLPIEFCRAYMGSVRFGELLMRCEKVRFVICGHQHARAAHRAGRLSAFLVGSEYGLKRLLEIDLETGEHSCKEFPASGTGGRPAGGAHEQR